MQSMRLKSKLLNEAELYKPRTINIHIIVVTVITIGTRFLYSVSRSNYMLSNIFQSYNSLMMFY